MNPLLLSGLLSLAPGLLSGLFGGDPQKKLRKQQMQLLSPQNLAQQTNTLYNQNLASPAYAQAQGTIAAGANQTANDVAGRLAQAGIGSSGTGAILSSLTPSLVGSQLGQLRTTAYGSAQNQAQNLIKQQLEVLQGTSGPSQTRQLFGAGLDTLGPILMQYLQGLQGRQGLPNQTLRVLQQQPVQLGGYDLR